MTPGLHVWSTYYNTYTLHNKSLNSSISDSQDFQPLDFIMSVHYILLAHQ